MRGIAGLNPSLIHLLRKVPCKGREYPALLNKDGRDIETTGFRIKYGMTKKASAQFISRLG